MSKIQVIQQEIPFYYNVKSFSIMIIGLELNKSVSILAKYYDVDDKFLFEEMYYIEGQEYSNWGSNDDYLINLVASKLGLVLEPQMKMSIIEIDGIKYIPV
jgi:acid phosphatase class B